MHRLLLTALFVVGTLHSVSSPVSAQDDPRRPAAITTENVPVVPPAVYERLSQYQSMRSATFHGWSPDGQGILIATRFGNSNQLHRVYQPGGRREQVTFFNEPVTGQFIPEAKDGSLLASMSEGGNENFQIYLIDRAKFQTTLLTDGKSRNSIGAAMRDGSKMIVHSNRRNGRDTDLYLADCRQPGSMELLLETKDEFWNSLDWSHDGMKVLLIRYVSINESYPYVLDVATKKLEPLPLPRSKEGKTAVGSLAFAADDKTVYATTDAQREFLALGKLDLETKTFTALSEDIAWDVANVLPKGGWVAFSTNEDGASGLYVIDPAGQRSKIEIPVGVVTGLEFSPDRLELGFSLAQPNAPTEAFSVALRPERGKLTRWTYSETGGMHPASFINPSLVRYSSFDGREIPAYYFKPRGASREKPASVLISIHGGPESQYLPIFSPIGQYYLNELGVAMLHPNVRGSAGYGKTYLQLDNAEKREESVRDIGALLDWIARQPELDSKRVAVIGGSYGGYMVLGSLVHFGDRIKAGIDIVGIANFITLLERTSPYRQDLRRAEYGDERDPKMRAVFEKISPISGANKIRSALLVVHGRNDPRVPFSEAEQIVQKVRAAGKPVWTVYADNEGHGFTKKDNRDYENAVEVMFLKEHLGL